MAWLKESLEIMSSPWLTHEKCILLGQGVFTHRSMAFAPISKPLSSALAFAG